MWKICRGEPWNLANWSAEFGKICRGKLWFLIIDYNVKKLTNSFYTEYTRSTWVTGNKTP